MPVTSLGNFGPGGSNFDSELYFHCYPGDKGPFPVFLGLACQCQLW